MIYEYQCPKCDGVWELMRPVDERDDPFECSICEVYCSRIISGAHFAIKGYSERNGYSDHIGNIMPKHLHGKKYK